ncbi:MAG: hypothetical protein QOG72_3095 [Sphingomonadales bacterium]|jgi:hypothetical protein|nr:hypothetical protein [Sphingomonadales bacterium]
MGITAIKRVFNNYREPVEIANSENPDKPRNGGIVPSGGMLEVDIWIPWAEKKKDITNHSIMVHISRIKTATIYQSKGEDGDFVRISTSYRSRFPAKPIKGYPEVDGDRYMIIESGGGIYLGKV